MRSGMLAVRRFAFGTITAGLLGALVATHLSAARSRTDFVELDVVAIDNTGRPIRYLQPADFEVKEDGRRVTITSFTEVSAAGLAGVKDGRSVVLFLDDTGLGAEATVGVRSVAKLFLAYTRPMDNVAVVRLTHRDDEAAGNLTQALNRVDAYRGGVLPYFGIETIDNALQAIARIARQVEPVAHRRKVLVCIGIRPICDFFSRDFEDSLLWPSWVQALGEAARANLSVYDVGTRGVEDGQFDLGSGLVENTGGGDFVKSNNFSRAASLIWDEASHYYLIGYTPSSSSRELHAIDVSTKRKGVTIRARLKRGD